MDDQEELTTKVTEDKTPKFTEDKTSKVTEDKTTKVTEDNILPQVYKRRWIILFLFSFVSLTNSFQWLHLNIIGDVLLNYYNASLPEDKFQQETALDWLSMVYMLAYIPLIFPVTWLLDKKGLRVVIICGSFLNAVGAWIKVACVSPDRFALLMFGQSVCSVAQVFILGIPARLAAIWFGPNQVSTATSLGVFGNQIGAAVGFLLPPLLVKYSPDIDLVSSRLYTLFYIGAGVTTLLFLMVLVIFKKEPPQPPSRAQLLAVRNAASQHYGKSLLRLLKNRGFLLLDHQKEAGEIGLTVVIAGIVGAILAGVWLDKTKTFKFFMTGYLPVGFEIAAEITYPESEGTSSGLLNASAQLFGIIFTISMRAMMNEVSIFGANITLSSFLLLGTILTDQLDNLREENPKSYWTLLESLKNSDKKTEKSSNITSTEWAEYFKDLNKKPVTPSPNIIEFLRNLENAKVFTELDILITDKEISDAIHTLKNKKSCGPDSISNEMIKNSQSFLIKSLNHVFNKILSTGNYPQIWANGFITALFKNGSKDDPSNYRGLTVTSCLNENLGVFTNDNDYEEPTTKTHKNSSSDSSELKEAEDCEPLVHEKPAILKRVGQKVLGQHGGDLLLHQSLYIDKLWMKKAA
ncbi:FLVCR [Mytilus edulis]|uniref:FLVCR n=1 Tax=Mytilus edulis TaxID=6550 RepID=A0A8S3UBD5_MYTED|nr:FLVCR [Mytilus edulis]